MALTGQRKHIAVCGMVLGNAPPRGSHVVMWTLAKAFAQMGYVVDFVVFTTAEKTFPWPVPENIRLVRLSKNSHFRSWVDLVRYVLRERPDVLLCNGTRANAYAPFLPRLKPPSIFAVLHTMLSEEFRQWHGIKRWRKIKATHALLKLDGVIAVSNAVAEDFKKLTGAASAPIQTIHNPLDLVYIRQKATDPVHHDFFAKGPVILGVGALVKNKNFAMLLQAFAKLPKELNLHLIILGEGKEKTHLLTLAQKLGIADRFDLPGFVDNPYAWMAKSRMVVVTSKAEGFCNVLAEAQALGVPAIATRCPGGPTEILEHGRYGLLVNVDDSEALAAAILQTLENPPTPYLLQQAAHRFSPEQVANDYLDYFFANRCHAAMISAKAAKER
jgi:glycosyltransferase involved in cell wall biosynthesis